MPVGSLSGQGWLQVGELALAFFLSALIGAEREIRHKSAGLRTYTLVGVSAALIMLVSKYGFTNVLENDRVVLDPSRIAAQIVTGIGFIGGGLIFVRRDNVRGLTTAAIVWLTAAIGMACGAGLPILALVVTAAHFTIVFGFPYLSTKLPRSRWSPSLVQITYHESERVLRDVLIACTAFEFAVSRLHVNKGHTVPAESESVRANADTDEPAAKPARPSAPEFEAEPSDPPAAGIVAVTLEVQGARSLTKLAARITDIPGVISVRAGDSNVEME